MFSFQDKVVLITGGSRGLGRAMSIGFAQAGAKVVIASRKIETCEALQKEISAAGGDALAVAAHMGNCEDLDHLIAATYEHYGRVDVLINNAAINIATRPLTEMNPEAFDKMYEVNLRGPWYLASRVAPRMAEQGGGAVINVLSVAGLKPPANMGFYASTKAGLEAMNKVMAQEWAPMKIRVNALALGTYHSDLVDTTIEQMPEYEQYMLGANLIKRLAESEEILHPIFYLAGESYTTGITLVADGGMLCK
ncbi:MAG: glucose 1-dehydrogenase [Deltaproteobacteria bacterium]|nr:glucose 1-dehydrogenase [Deltaproteobacteria bacterium]MBW2359356.1 glucose 1-dehydrogenase [Deltaproteobacteria bacterium]